MMSDLFAPDGASARVVGIVRGREIDAPARVVLDGMVVVLQWEQATPWRMALDGIDGVVLSPRATTTLVTLYLASGDVLELSGDDTLRVLGETLLQHACTMPELTRDLRSLGSQRGAPGASHDAWFAALLSARRAVEGVFDPLRHLALFDATRLSAAATAVIAELAAIRAPTDAPAQRAIEAVLEEGAAPLFVAYERMRAAGDTLRGSAPDVRLAAWRAWVETVKQSFAAADGAWEEIRGELA
jgi:hypothetical protein